MSPCEDLDSDTDRPFSVFSTICVPITFATQPFRCTFLLRIFSEFESNGSTCESSSDDSATSFWKLHLGVRLVVSHGRTPALGRSVPPSRRRHALLPFRRPFFLREDGVTSGHGGIVLLSRPRHRGGVPSPGGSIAKRNRSRRRGRGKTGGRSPRRGGV